MRTFLIAGLLLAITSVTYCCDCDYNDKGWQRGGGCKISKPAPPNKACKCTYKGWWTCGGQDVWCETDSKKNNFNPLCLKPDDSRAACNLGRGECLGY
jgi:hypothetical protein